MTKTLFIALLVSTAACAGKAATDSRASAGGGGEGANAPGDNTGAAPSGGGAALVLDAGSSAFDGSAVVNPGPACIDTSACSVTAADIACNAEADCGVLVLPGCGATTPVIGVNLNNHVTCAPRKCTSPQPDGYVLQDCNETTEQSNVTLHCIEHRCVTALYGCSPCDIPR